MTEAAQKAIAAAFNELGWWEFHPGPGAPVEQVTPLMMAIIATNAIEQAGLVIVEQ